MYKKSEIYILHLKLENKKKQWHWESLKLEYRNDCSSSDSSSI